MEAVLVSLNILEEGNDTFKNTLFTTSGIEINERWILTHGTLVSMLKVAKNIVKTNSKNKQLYQSLPKVYVTHENKSCRNSENFLDNIIVSPGIIKYIWQSNILKDLFDSFFMRWTIGHKPGNNSDQDNSGVNFLPVFLLIDIGSDGNEESPRNVLLNFYQRLPKELPQRRDELTVFGTPFGNEVFLNTQTCGGVCNVVGPSSNILLCDAPTSIGFEGGPVFYKNSGELAGITLNSLSWWKGEWVGITLMASLAPLIHEVLYPSQPYQSNISITSKDIIIDSVLDSIDKSIGLVRCGETWGSGVFIGRGYLLTCSHCVKEHRTEPLTVYLNGRNMKANVIFKSRDDTPYDLALLSLDGFHSGSDCIQMAETPSIKGENVVAVGFPYFSERQIKNIKPSITKGSITNTTPYMIQTSCCVQSGFSGGAILRILQDRDKLQCQLLGIIVCNAKDDSKSVIFPNLNMAVPVHAFKDVLQSFLNNESSSNILKALENSRQDVQSLWRLQYFKSKL